MSSTWKTTDRRYVSIYYIIIQFFLTPSIYFVVGYTNTHMRLFCLTLSCTSSDAVEAFRGSEFGHGTGPIFLNQLGCSGTESSLVDCNRFAGLGLHSCDHSQDAGISCIGEKINLP